ncbi:50S ribosomal protein L23 [Flaviflexus equikiangi]|uniref:Large ribosomal subunit protein uL23 n=1 Tax=Flaviflexus equikiangi TaxID=2758573 RepID=A0ABS2TJ34_9ACTO|nr:50S ribosomal protein L23 [Flaviflexus equikiangi]MBM9433772.1 50S ribosomal protein L23 [Flaviflexus equikiangi]
MTLVRKDPRDIIIRPIVTEKSYRLEEEGKYVFEVAPTSNKTEIKIAIEKIFNVKVDSVNTMNRKGKTRRTRNGIGKRKDTKRAIVSLREGSIELYGQIG